MSYRPRRGDPVIAALLRQGLRDALLKDTELTEETVDAEVDYLIRETHRIAAELRAARALEAPKSDNQERSGATSGSVEP